MSDVLVICPNCGNVEEVAQRDDGTIAKWPCSNACVPGPEENLPLMLRPKDALAAARAPLQAIIDAHALCHDKHGKVGPCEFAMGCADEQRKLYGRAPHADALVALAAAVEYYLDHPGCNNPARATAMARLRWAKDQARLV